MEQKENKQNNADENMKILWVLLSVLGLFLIVGAAGFFFFAPRQEPGEVYQPSLNVTEIVEEIPEAPAQEFDPVELLRENEDYPGLRNKEEEDKALDLDRVSVSPEKSVEGPVKPKTKIIKPSRASKPARPKVRYKEVQVQVYWIQVGSYSSMTKAEGVRSDLGRRGLNSIIQTRNVDGKAIFRVRIGSFAAKAEAEKFCVQVKSLKGYEQSFVIQSAMKKKVPLKP